MTLDPATSRTSAVTAAAVPIVDAGGYYSGTEVEDALQEAAIGRWVLEEEITVGAGGQASFDFQGIPATYRELLVTLYGLTEEATTGFDGLRLRFNNDVAGNYYYSWMQREAAFTSGNDGGQTSILAGQIAKGNSNLATLVRLAVPYYRSSFGKNVECASGGHGGGASQVATFRGAGLWTGGAVINRITLFLTSGNDWKVNSVGRLYGLL